MISGNKNWQAFYGNLVHALIEKNERLHYPDSTCYQGHCGCITRFNWREFRRLAKWFWDHGPDVDEDWKRTAQRATFEFNADDLHDIMLGVFIGGDGSDRRPFRLPKPTAGTPLTR